MSKEAMQQAMEALEEIRRWTDRWTTPGHPVSTFAEKAIVSLSKALAEQPAQQEPVATVESVATVVSESGNQEVTMSWWHEPALPVGTKLYTTPPQRTWVVFPTMLRKMWSGSEVQAWLDENVNKENT